MALEALLIPGRLARTYLGEAVSFQTVVSSASSVSSGFVSSTRLVPREAASNQDINFSNRKLRLSKTKTRATRRSGARWSRHVMR